MAIENDLTEICFLGGFLGNWEWEGHVFSTINKNLSSLSSSPFPKKAKEKKGQILLSPLLPPGGPPIPIFYGKGRCLSTQQPIFLCFQYFPSSETLPSQCRRNCRERFIWEVDVVEVTQAIGNFQWADRVLNSKRNVEEGPFGYWKRHPPAEGERGLVDKRPEKKRFGWLESGPPPHFLYPLSIAVYCRTKMPERGKLVKYPGGRWMYSWLWDTCAFKIETGEPFPASAFAWKEEKQPEKMGSEKIEHSSGVSMWTFPVLTHLTQFRLT